MIKHIDIIQKMSDDQKLALAASLKALALPEFAALGIPCVRHSGPNRVNAAMGHVFPPYVAAANSWDDRLIGEMTGELARHAAQNGVNMLFTPKLRLRGAYSDGLTEDPCLSIDYAEKITSAIGAQGVMPCAGGCSFSDNDVRYADKVPDERALTEYHISVFGNMFTDCPCAVSTEYTALGGAYDRINTKTINDYLHSWKYSQIICEKVDDDKYVSCLAGGNLIWSGDAGVLREAYDRYLALKAKVDSGECYIEELTKACESGEALDDATLDAAVDRAIEFAFDCQAQANGVKSEGGAADIHSLALRAAEESIVLLKNSQALPLKDGIKIAVIGHLPCNSGGFSDELFAQKIKEGKRYQLVGRAAGYDAFGDRNDDMLEEARALCEQADVAVLFMGTDENREQAMLRARRSKLPANQLALADALSRTGKQVIAVLSSRLSIDMSFDERLSATILAPVEGAFACDALYNIMCGVSCPSGRLAYTCYDDADALFSSLKAAKDGGRNKVGVFVGYRSYDGDAAPVRYPFGFGLSYTSFAYSDLKISGENISFKLKNTGKVAGCEVAQIYIGKSDSSLARPVKELKGFVRVQLAPGQEKYVTVAIPRDKLAVVCDGKDAIEGGKYGVYVCSDVTSVRLSGEMTVSGIIIPRGASDSSDFRPSQSNILSGGYTFGKVKAVETRGRGLSKTGAALAIAALAVAIVFAFLSGTMLVPMYMARGWFIACSLFFVAGAVMFLVGWSRTRRAKAKAITVSEGFKVMKNNLKAAQPYELLFDECFAGEDDVEEQVLPVAEEEERYIRYDSSMSLTEICQKLKDFSAQRGLILDDKSVYEVIASFCSSRLIIMHGQPPEVTAALIGVLSEFFGSGLYMQDSFGGYSSPYDFIYGVRGGEEKRTPAAKAISDAVSHADKAYIAALNGTSPAELSSFFLPFTKYVNYPDRGATVMLSQSGADGRLYIPNNVWFVFSFKEGADVCALDGHIADCACLMSVSATLSERGEDSVYEDGIVRIGQLEWAGKKYCADYVLGEESAWKKIDKLEKYLYVNAGYHIPNKMWSAMEIYSSVLLACGEEEPVALDCTVAAKLLLAAYSRLGKKAFADENGLSAATDEIFGEGNMAKSKKLMGIIGAAALSVGAKGE